MWCESWNQIRELPVQRRERIFDNRVVSCFQQRLHHTFDLLENGRSKNPNGDAVICGEIRSSYIEIYKSVEMVSIGLQAMGVKSETRVGILMHNCPEFIVLIFAVIRLGGIVVPLNIREAKPELEYVLNDCGAEVLVYHETLRDKVPHNTNFAHLVKLVCIPETDHPFKLFASQCGKLPKLKGNELDTAVILYTSGTTGLPKGAKISHLNIIHSVMHYQKIMDITKDDRSVIAVPMSHVTGLVALVATIVGAGATLIIMPKFSAEQFVDLMVSERVTHTVIVPAMFNLLLLTSSFESADLSHWRVSGYGGAIMPETTLQRVLEAMPNLQLINCYGATETTSPAAMMPPMYADTRIRQVGLPVPCAEIIIVDEDGREVKAGESGEIWISGPMVVAGYWNNVAATDKEFVGKFWRSGDIGCFDEFGFLRVIDRIKDVINRGGFKIFASEVENLLLGYPGVIEAAAVASPCSVLGERVHAFIVIDSKIDIAMLKNYCAAKIADYKVPENIKIIDEFPRNANGKVLKRELRLIIS